MNLSLIFWEPRFSKSRTTPDVVYVPINSSLRFCKPWFTNSYTTPDVVYVPIN